MKKETNTTKTTKTAKTTAKTTTAKKAAAAPKAKAATSSKAIEVKEAEVAKVVDTGEDLYVVLNGQKHQFSSQISSFYDVKEYFYKGSFTKGDSVKFVRGNGEQVPVHHTPNCGYTLVGKAQRLLAPSKALVASGESGDDQEYVYINDHSTLSYVGESGEHTIFLRVYDNINGINNDRWAVIYID